MVHRPFSSFGCAGICWNRCDSEGLYVNSDVSSPYFSLIRALQGSLRLGRWSKVGATGTPVTGAAWRLMNGCLICCLGARYSSSLSYSAGVLAALTIRASKKSKASKTTAPRATHLTIFQFSLRKLYIVSKFPVLSEGSSSLQLLSKKINAANPSSTKINKIRRRE